MTANNGVTGWLKKLFSVQTISLLIAVFAAYFTYKAYVSGQPGRLDVELPVLNQAKDDISYIDAEGISRYFSIGYYGIPPVTINNGFIGGPENMLLFPVISNQSDKSLKDFSADIHILFDDVMAPLFNDSDSDESFLNLTDYDIKSRNSRNIQLTYNKGNLAANKRLPDPLRTFFLNNAGKKIATTGGQVVFTYYVTYDGAKEPLNFQYNARMYFDENWDNRPPDRKFTYAAFKSFLKNTVFENSLHRSNFENGEWVLINRNKLYRNIKHLTPGEFADLDNISIPSLQEK